MQEEQSSTSLKQKAYLAIGVLSITVAVATAGVSLYRRYKYERLKELFDKYGVTLPDPVQN